VTAGAPVVASEPAWSPDGAKLACTVYRDDMPAIAVINRDGSGERRPTDPAAPDGHPAWSPDGSQIAFSRIMGPHDNRIHVMSADGEDVRTLTGRQASEFAPAWHPSGRTLLFSDADTHTLVKFDLADERRESIAAAAWFAEWSPDGRRIAARIGTDVYVMDGDGDNLRRLTQHPAHDSEPSWSPDGRQLVFTSDRDGITQIYRIDADGGNVRRLVAGRSLDTNPAWWGPSKLAVTSRERRATMWGWLRTRAIATR
jgi:Tol biopolymer transport system component